MLIEDGDGVVVISRLSSSSAMVRGEPEKRTTITNNKNKWRKRDDDERMLLINFIKYFSRLPFILHGERVHGSMVIIVDFLREQR